VPEALTIFATESPYELRNLRTKIAGRLSTYAGQLAAGSAQDWPDYKERVGVIKGLTEALNICDELEKRER
jgi:hypothetical protein